MLQLPPDPSVEPIWLSECPRKGPGHADVENQAEASSPAATARTILLWMPSVVWALAQCNVSVQRGAVDNHILYPVIMACMLIWMITCGANYRELIFLLLLICAHHFTDPGCELQINTQQLPCGDKRIFCYIQLLLHYSWYRNWEKRDFYLSSTLIYALTSLQKKCINIFDGEMTSHNAELHFDFFFPLVHESAFPELRKLFCFWFNWDHDQLWFCFLFGNVSYETFNELRLKIECIYYICFPLFQTVCWEPALVNVHFFFQLKYWQFGVADTLAFDLVVFLQCAVWNISRLNQQSQAENAWTKVT